MDALPERQFPGKSNSNRTITFDIHQQLFLESNPVTSTMIGQDPVATEKMVKIELP